MENLGCLHGIQETSVDIHAIHRLQLAAFGILSERFHRVHARQHGNDCRLCLCGFKHPGNHIARQQGPHTIMDGDHSSVRNCPESILHRMETGESPFHYGLGANETCPYAVFLPPRNMRFRQDSYHFYSWYCRDEFLYRQTENSLASYFEKLFRYLCPHPGAASPGNGDQYFLSCSAFHILQI